MNKKDKPKNKVITFRPTEAMVEMLERYRMRHGTTTIVEAIEGLFELGTLLDLSNEYNDEDAPGS